MAYRKLNQGHNIMAAVIDELLKDMHCKHCVYFRQPSILDPKTTQIPKQHGFCHGVPPTPMIVPIQGVGGPEMSLQMMRPLVNQDDNCAHYAHPDDFVEDADEEDPTQV